MVSTEDLIAQPGIPVQPEPCPLGTLGTGPGSLAPQPPSVSLLGSLSSSLDRGHGSCHYLWTHHPQLSLGRAQAGCKDGRGASQGWSICARQHVRVTQAHPLPKEGTFLLPGPSPASSYLVYPLPFLPHPLGPLIPGLSYFSSAVSFPTSSTHPVTFWTPGLCPSHPHPGPRRTMRQEAREQLQSQRSQRSLGI